MTASEIAVTVIGGYLGAGKTTLVNHLLRSSGEPIGVIVNDFGEVNIDADLIENQVGDTISLSNGCICCSLVDGFGAALETATAATVRPKRLLIEASGVADPAAVAAWAHAPGLRLDGVAVLADLMSVRRQLDDPWIGDVVKQQLVSADLIIANKLDSGAAETAADLELTFRTPTLTATNADVAPELVFESIRSASTPLASSLGVASDLFTTQSWRWDSPVDDAELDALLASFEGPEVERVKGVVRVAGSPDVRVVIQQVGGDQKLTTSPGWPGGPSQLFAVRRRGGVRATG